MKKSDLKYGNVVETRNGAKFFYSSVCAQQLLIPLDGNGCLDYEARYSNGLKHKAFCDLDIMKVYKDYTCKELLWERKEKPKLTEDEKCILRSLPKKYKWIARDKRDNLSVFVGEPIKLLAILSWGGEDGEEKDFPFDDLFQFIKWEDNRPYNIRDLLKGE